MKEKKVAIFIIAYEAVRTLITAYERIPDSIKESCEEIYVMDDHSGDNTYWAGIGYKLFNKIEKLNVYRNESNELGYISLSVSYIDPFVRLHNRSYFSTRTPSRLK